MVLFIVKLLCVTEEYLAHVGFQFFLVHRMIDSVNLLQSVN